MKKIVLILAEFEDNDDEDFEEDLTSNMINLFEMNDFIYPGGYCSATILEDIKIDINDLDAALPIIAKQINIE